MDLFRKVFKPKSVAAITASLTTMMSQLTEHKEAKNQEIKKIDDRIATLHVDRTSAAGEIALAEKVFGNLQKIFK